MRTLLENRKQKLQLFCISIVALFLASGGAATTGPTTELFLRQACQHFNIDPSSDDCKNNNKAEHYANNRLLKMALVNYVPQLLAGAMTSHLADVFGRRRGMAWGMLGAMCTALFPAVIPREWFESVLLPGLALANCTGGFFCAMGVTFAYVADVTSDCTPAQRQRIFALQEAMMWLGLLIGPVVSGLIAQHFTEQYALLYAFFSELFAFVLVLTVLPNPTPHSASTFSPSRLNLSKMNPFASVFDFATRRHFTAPLIGIVVVLCMTVVICLNTASPVWLRNNKNFSYTQIGLMQSFVYAANAIGLVVMMPLMQYLGIGPKWNFVAGTVSLIGWPAVWAGGLNPFFGPAVGCLASLGLPIARTMVTAMYPPNDYGLALGVVATLEALATCIGALAAPSLLNAFGWRMTFLTCSGLGAVSMLCVLLLPRHLYSSVGYTETKIENSSNLSDASPSSTTTAITTMTKQPSNKTMFALPTSNEKTPLFQNSQQTSTTMSTTTTTPTTPTDDRYQT